MTTNRETANEKYTARRDEIEGLLTRIEEALTSHAEAQAAQPKNWCFTGDLGHVAERLREVAEFIES